jgi:hypothetical protein
MILDIGYYSDGSHQAYHPNALVGHFTLAEGYTHWSDFSTGEKVIPGVINKNNNLNLCSVLKAKNDIVNDTINITDTNGFIYMFALRRMENEFNYLRKLYTENSFDFYEFIYATKLVYTYDDTKLNVSESSTGETIYGEDGKRHDVSYRYLKFIPIVTSSNSIFHLEVEDNPLCEADSADITVNVDYNHLDIASKLTVTELSTLVFRSSFVSKVGTRLTYNYIRDNNAIYHINASLTMGSLSVASTYYYDLSYMSIGATNNSNYAIFPRQTTSSYQLDPSCLTINSSLTTSNLNNVFYLNNMSSQPEGRSLLFADQVGNYAIFIAKFVLWGTYTNKQLSAINNSLTISYARIGNEYRYDKFTDYNCKSISFNNEAWMFEILKELTDENEYITKFSSFRYNSSLVKTDNTFLDSLPFIEYASDNIWSPYILGKSNSKLFIASRLLNRIYVVNTSYTVSLLPYAISEIDKSYESSINSYQDSVGTLNGKAIWSKYASYYSLCNFTMDDNLTLTYDPIRSGKRDSGDDYNMSSKPNAVIGNYAIANKCAISISN